MLTGQNGILTQAQNSKKQMRIKRRKRKTKQNCSKIKQKMQVYLEKLTRQQRKKNIG